jgi:hypothetical protein
MKYNVAMKNLLVSMCVILFGSLGVSAQTTYGCNDPDAHNYVPPGGFTINSNCKYTGDSCGEGSVYDAAGACIQTVVGCMDASACNFKFTANQPHICVYEHTVLVSDNANGNGAGCWVCSQTIGAAPHGDGQGVLEDNDMNDNGICDETEVVGCMDASACNFDIDATVEFMFSESGSPCEFLDGVCDFCASPDGTTIDDGNGQALLTHPDYQRINGDIDGDGVCDIDEVEGCKDATACNYNASATDEDGSCIIEGSCGCSGGEAVDLQEGFCGCDGETLDALLVCLLPANPDFCQADANTNGICDNLEIPGCMDSSACDYAADANVPVNCLEVDECGECGGSGVPAGFCDCAGTLADVNTNGVCDVNEVEGCIDSSKCNFDAKATLDDGTCKDYDACNICGGTNATVPVGYCDCNGNTLDVLGVCGGGCEADNDNDGICNDVDPCPDNSNNTIDECGVCGGPGAIYDASTCGCEPIDPSACDCDEVTGNQNYPTPGQYCDGTCTDGQDANGICIVISGAVETVQPAVTVRTGAGSNRIAVEQNPFKLEEWMANIDSLHSRMSRNLDDGSLLGSSDSLTIEDQIVSNGHLKVAGGSDLGYLYVPDPNLENTWEEDSVVIKTNLFVRGYARIKGTTFSDGGIETTAIDLSGDMSIGGKLLVKGLVEFKDTLNVAEAIQVGSKNQVRIDSTGWIEADSITIRKSLRVIGNTVLQKDLDVSGEFTVKGVNSADRLTVSSAGNTGMSGNLVVGGNALVEGNHTVSGTLNVGSSGNFTGNLASKALTVGGNLQHNGTGTFHSKAKKFLIGKESASLPMGGANQIPTDSYGLIVDGKGTGNYNGIAIRVDSDNPGNYNNFVTFLNKNGQMVGRIEGEGPGEQFYNPVYTKWTGQDAASVIVGGIDLNDAIKTNALHASAIAAEVGKAVSASLPSVGFVSADVAETVAHGVVGAGDVIKLLASIHGTVGASIGLALGVAGAVLTQTGWEARRGVAYKSGSADYAEWIEKENHREEFYPGEIVGVVSGKVTYDTDNSDHILVISTSPIVLGNDPGVDQEKYFEKIAFMGQVPIRIQGSVKEGDFILPSGENNGLGYAISKEDIALYQIPQIVGVAWADGENDVFNVVNCSIGLENNGMKALVNHVETRLDEIEAGISNNIDLKIAQLSASNETSSKRKRRFWFKPASADTELVAKGNSLPNRLVKQDSKPMALSSGFSGQDQNAAEDQGASQLTTEVALEHAVSSIVNQLNTDGAEVTAQEWNEGLENLGVAMEGASEKLDVFLANGGDLSHDLTALFDFGAIPQNIVQANAEITLAIFDHFVSPTALTPMFREQINIFFKDLPAQKKQFLIDYPAGSQAEKAFLENLTRKMEMGLYRADPSTAIYGRGRVK